MPPPHYRVRQGRRSLMPGTGDLRTEVYDAALARREPYTASCTVQMAEVSASNLRRC